jgi:hypothetical protein
MDTRLLYGVNRVVTFYQWCVKTVNRNTGLYRNYL